MSFFETSAKRDIGVAEAFLSIAKQVVSRLGDAGGGKGGAGGRGGPAKPADDKPDLAKAKPADGKSKCC